MEDAMSTSAASSSSDSSGVSIPLVEAPPRPAMHVVSMHGSHTQNILERLESPVASHEALAKLDVARSHLGDDGAGEILTWLMARRASWPKPLLEACTAQLPKNEACFDDVFDRSFRACSEEEQREQRKAIMARTRRIAASLSQSPSHRLPAVRWDSSSASPKPRVEPRSLQLSSTKLTTCALRSLAWYVRGNAALNALELQHNDLGGDSWALASFARTLFLSGLRHLHLASTKLEVHDFIAFLDSLRSASLRQLNLSVAMPNDTTPADARAAAAVVARLLRHRDGSLAIAQQEGWAPQLETLSLNGNEFTWKGVRAIVAAVLGAVPPSEAGSFDAPRPNRTLLHLELFATISDERSSSDSEEEQEETERGGVARRAGRPLSVSSSLRAQAQEARARARDAAWSNSATPGGVTPPRMGAAEAARRTPILLPGSSSRALAEEPADAASQSSSQRAIASTPTAGELYEQITRADWRRLLGAQLWRNSSERIGVQSAALSVLVAARLLGCKSREKAPRQEDVANSNDDVSMEPASFPFARLPLELRLAVLRQLDERRALSEQQFGRVVAWASDASTLGYGCGFGLSVPRLDLPPPAEREALRQSLLPTHAWDWHASLRRSVPRDWEAELLDKAKDNLGEGWGGGGGPDGTGGVKKTKREVRPGMAAFWEMTGTETPE